MRIRFVVRQAFPQGGLSLAAFRLAQALNEVGHDAGVLVGGGEPPPELQALARKVDGLSSNDARCLSRALERVAPDLVLVCEGSPEWLQAASSVAPTALHAHAHWGVCADAARYWSRQARPCSVRAGWHCVALRPLLGCSDLSRARDPRHVARQRQILAMLRSNTVGIVAVSTDQAELYADHGLPQTRIAVVPNLGIRMTADELCAAAASTPERWRGVVAFFGRLTKAKGAELLLDIADQLGADRRLCIFGEGYLAKRLELLPPGSICGQVRQSEVAGVLMWAQAVAFPSLWPEPGGIVGVDAQIMGVPVAAFDVGAARFWPDAVRFPLGDASNMAMWLAEQSVPSAVRDPEKVAAMQGSYWQRIAHYASTSLETFVRSSSFERVDDPVEKLIAEARCLD